MKTNRPFHSRRTQVQWIEVRAPRHRGLVTSPSCGTSPLGLQALRPGFAALLALFTSGLAMLAAELAPPIVLESPNAQDQGYFAETLAPMPDVNGDSKANIIVGAWHEGPGASPTDAGRVYLFDGVTRQLLRDLRSPGEVAGRSERGIHSASALAAPPSSSAALSTAYEN